MKKWNSSYLLYNDHTNSYVVSGTTSEGDNVTLVPDPVFRRIMMTKYNIFNYTGPAYYDQDAHNWVSLVTTKQEAIAAFFNTFTDWMNDKKPGYMKLYEALRSEYDPISNYDKTIHETTTYEGTETNTETPSGTETTSHSYAGSEKVTETPTGSEQSTLTKSGSEKVTETPTGSEQSTLTKSGTETSTETPSGTEQVQHSLGQAVSTISNTTFDESTFYDKQKTTDDARTNTDTTSYNQRQTEVELSFTDRADTESKTFINRKTETDTSFTNRQDTESKTFINRKTETEKTYTNRQDTDTRSFTNRQTETVKAFDERVDTHDYHEFGNIGVTTSQQMITSQFPLTELDKLQHYIVNDFVHSNLII